MEISDRVILAGLIYFMKLKGGSDSAFTPDLDPNAKTQTAEDTSGGESKDPDKDKDKGTPGGGNGQGSGKKTPINKLKNQIAAVTGDEARPMLYALAAIAAAAMISVTVIRRKNK